MDFRAFYDTHASFVWRALLRVGVPEGEVADAMQDVFVVVHRKLPEFEGRSKVTTWLFRICLRVAADRRKLAHGRYEIPSEHVADALGAKARDDAKDAPDALADRRRARATLEAILARMPEEQRLVFSLFELDGMTGEEIAELLDVPVGTIRSRLRLARAVFEESVARLRARDEAHHPAVLRPSEAR